MTIYLNKMKEINEKKRVASHVIVTTCMFWFLIARFAPTMEASNV
jgi:hypothetical protein